MSNQHLPSAFAPYSPRHRLRGLYVITHAPAAQSTAPAARKNRPPTPESNLHLQITRAALAGGARVVQLRDKGTPLAQLLPLAGELRRLTHRHGALLIVNDRVDVALACQADGVHLGPDDMPLADARRLLGPHRILGASCGDAQEARRAAAQGADYIGAGAVFATATKSDAGAPIGLKTLQAIVSATTLPVAAIGGVDVSNIASTRSTGAAMWCVVSAVAGAGDESDMAQATRELISAATRNEAEA